MTKIRAVFLLVLLVSGAVLSAAVTRQEMYQGKKVYTLENEKLILRIDPSEGGKGISYYLKDQKKELVDPKKDCGFFLDHWAIFTWPSGLFHLPYSAEFVNVPGGAGIKLSLKVPSVGGGKGSRDKTSSLKIPTEKDLIGLEISKTIVIKDGSDIVRVSLTLRNPTSESRAGSIYTQHGFRLDPQAANYRWDMPSAEGFIGPARKNLSRPSGKHWNTSPVAGWMSCSDLKAFNMVFEFDYNYLDKMYSCGTTAEWMMENVILPPGKSFKTEYQFYPLTGFERVSYAKDGIVGGIRADEAGKGFQISTDLLSKKGSLKDLTLRVKIFSHRNKGLLAEKTFRINELGSKVKTFTMDCPVREEIVIKAELTGKKDLNAKFEYNYINEEAEYNRRFFYGSLGTGAAALSGGRGTAYTVKPPVKNKTMDLPDFSKMAKFPKDKNRMLVLFGLYTNHLQIHKIFRHDKNTEITWCNARPNGVGKFPATFEALFRFRTIFMCNVNYKSLRFEGLEMIRNWIKEGGTLVITGGFYTYGNGEFEGTPFEKFVPFQNMKPFDLEWAGENKSFQIKQNGKHPELAGVDFNSSPDVAWIHKLERKPGSEILASAGNYPVIVKMKYGKGTVIACALTPLGEPEKPFWLGDGWKNFLINCSKINKN